MSEVMNQKKQLRRRRRPRRGQRGLTLIEILVVVTILGLIAGIVGITVANQLEDAKIDTGNVQMKNISEALELYKIKFNRYPNTAEGLQALVKPPGGKKPLMETVPKDPWDQEYIFVSPGTHNQSKFDLQSKGPDGVAETEDDLKNW
ncbi:MAG: type II secretion system major pseudopilin GspG [Deltaproteobacteria bacterium]